jgi:PleD family two-component response regulator
MVKKQGLIQTFLSAGIAQSNGQANANELIEQADRALYSAKAAGRNVYGQ